MVRDSSEDAARAARARTRSQRLTVRVRRLDEGDDDDEAPTTPVGRIELLVELSRAAWAMTGLPWPDAPRHTWPIRVLPLKDCG